MTQTIPHEAPPAVTTGLPAAHNVVFHAADDSDIDQARSYLLAELAQVGCAAPRGPTGRRARSPSGCPAAFAGVAVLCAIHHMRDFTATRAGSVIVLSRAHGLSQVGTRKAAPQRCST